MATCDPNELLETGKCFACLSEQQVQMVKLGLLCQILQAYNPMATCDVETLLQDAKCFCGMSQTMTNAVEIQLLCEILHGGATGTSCIVCVDGEETPTDPAPCTCSIAYNQVGQFWFWHDLTNTWVPFIL